MTTSNRILDRLFGNTINGNDLAAKLEKGRAGSVTLNLATTSLAAVNEARALVKMLSSPAELRAMQVRVAQKQDAEDSLRQVLRPTRLSDLRLRTDPFVRTIP